MMDTRATTSWSKNGLAVVASRGLAPIRHDGGGPGGGAAQEQTTGVPAAFSVVCSEIGWDYLTEPQPESTAAVHLLACGKALGISVVRERK